MIFFFIKWKNSFFINSFTSEDTFHFLFLKWNEFIKVMVSNFHFISKHRQAKKSFKRILFVKYWLWNLTVNVQWSQNMVMASKKRCYCFPLLWHKVTDQHINQIFYWPLNKMHIILYIHIQIVIISYSYHITNSP